MAQLQQHRHLAQEAFARQDWNTALIHADAALAQAPDASTAILASYIHSYLGHYRAARTYAEQAVQLPPDSFETALDIVSRLRTFNAAQAMQDYARRLGPPARLPIPVLLQLAAQFSYLNLQTQALAYAEEALRGDPDYPPAQVATAQLMIYNGRLEEAARLLRRTQKRAPEIALTYWLLAQLGAKLRGDVDDIAAVRLQLQRPGRRAPEITELQMALHRLLDDAGRYDEAAAALAQACATRRAALQYDTGQSRSLFAALKQLPLNSESQPSVRDAADGLTPIFIVGMHRSGTTLLEQLLSSHPLVAGIGELYDFTSAMRDATDWHCRGVIDMTLVQRALTMSPDYTAAGARYLDGVSWRLGDARWFTDKLPSNFLNIGFIAQALPQARILHMVRDPVETCFSNLREIFSDANPYSYDQIELADYYALYDDLMRHWRAQLPGRTLDVDYRRLTTDTETVMREVATFTGLDFQPQMVDTGAAKRGVATASAVQVRGGVTHRNVPKWKPYEQWLQPLIARLRNHGIALDG